LIFHHENGEISRVKIEIAGVGIRRVRVSTLPPEITETQIMNVMSAYGDVKTIHDEVWANTYRVKVKTGVRLVDIGLKKHIPSHIKIDGHRALISYEGQPITCFRCNEQGHQIHECPHRRTQGTRQTSNDVNTWATIVKRPISNGPIISTSSTTNDLIPPNDEAIVISDPLTMPTDNVEHETTTRHDQTQMELSHSPSVADTVPNDEEGDNTNCSDMMEEERNQPTHDSKHTCTYMQKWADVLSTDAESEYEHDKQRKKREKPVQTNDDKQDGKGSYDITTEATTNQQTQMISPKRSKKIKVDRDIVTTRERTRSQSRQKTPCISRQSGTIA